MRKHQHVALFQIRLDILFIHSGLFLIIDQNHDDISLLRCLRSGINLESLCLGFSPGLTALVKADNNITAGILQVQCVSVSLAAVTDDGYFFSFQQRKVAVLLIKNLCCHLCILHIMKYIC